MAARKRAGKRAKKPAKKPAGKRANKPAASPTINPEPVVVPPAPGGYRKTEGTDRCPVEGCPVTFSSNNNLRAITIHIRGIVKKGRAYYANKNKGAGYWEAHNRYYEEKQEEKGEYSAIL
jgi:hypothetical protein